MKFGTTSLSRLSVLAFFVLLTGTGCSKGGGAAPGASGQLFATIGGISFQPSSVEAVNDGSNIVITGAQLKTGDTSAMEIDIPNTVRPGQVAVPVSVYFVRNAETYGIGPSPVTVTLSSIDTVNHLITGSFNGTIYNNGDLNTSLQCNGQFNTTYLQ